jgi:hypothetical protein
LSVTIYLTDHNGRKISFFYRIDNERYLTAPQLIWQCKEYRQYKGTAESKEDFIEQCKQAIKMINRNLSKECKECGLTNPKMEAQSTCPECLIDNE